LKLEPNLDLEPEKLSEHGPGDISTIIGVLIVS